MKSNNFSWKLHLPLACDHNVPSFFKFLIKEPLFFSFLFNNICVCNKFNSTIHNTYIIHSLHYIHRFKWPRAWLSLWSYRSHKLYYYIVPLHVYDFHLLCVCLFKLGLLNKLRGTFFFLEQGKLLNYYGQACNLIQRINKNRFT